MTLKRNKASSFLEKVSQLDGIDEQLKLAKITGNFKRGNEKNKDKVIPDLLLLIL